MGSGQITAGYLAEAERAATLAKEVRDPLVKASWEKIAAAYREMAQQASQDSAALCLD